MSKHSLVLWPLLLLLLWVFWGVRGLVMFFLKKIFFFFDGKSVLSALCSYYYMCIFV